MRIIGAGKLGCVDDSWPAPAIGIFDVLREYFVQNYAPGKGVGPRSLLDNELGVEASDCCKLQVAGFLSMCEELGLGDDSGAISGELVSDVDRRSDESDWYSIPYNVPFGETGQQDIAEIGASVDALYWASQKMDSPQRKVMFARLGDDIMLRTASECSGAYYKNPAATQHDVLNGDVYAALVLMRAFEITGKQEYADQVHLTVQHLLTRFGVHVEDGWAYSERWDGTASIGYSVAYQATITAWGAGLLNVLDGPQRSDWEKVLTIATDRVHSDLLQGPSAATEAPSWSRTWDGIWEIYLALSRWRHDGLYDDYLSNRFRILIDGVSEMGMQFFADERPRTDGRSATGSTLRKAANFGAIMSAIYFESRCGYPS